MKKTICFLLTAVITSAASLDAAPIPGRFFATGPMHYPRSGHHAVRLNDGRVLVVGGTAEIYNPATGQFTLAGPMVKGSNGPATLLRDGRVLIAGGNPEGTAELYDPGTDSFRLTAGRMVSPGDTYRSVLLPNGKVLLEGDGVELFDPITETFRPTMEPIPFPLFRSTATLLTTGKVLIYPTKGPGFPNDFRAVLFDPSTGRFAESPLPSDHVFHEDTLLNDGRVLITNGAFYAPTLPPLLAAVISSSGTSTVYSANRLNQRFHGTATRLANGQVLLSGGTEHYDQSPPSVSFNSANIFDPATLRFEPVDHHLFVPRANHTATLLLDGAVLITGGWFIPNPADPFPSTSAHASAELFRLGSFPNTPPVADAGPMRDLFTGPDGLRFITLDAINSHDPEGDPLTYTWAGAPFGTSSGRLLQLSLSPGAFSVTLTAEDPDGATGSTTVQIRVRPEPPVGKFLAAGQSIAPRNLAARLPDGRVFLAGSTPANEIYDPASGGFTGTGAFPQLRSVYALSALPNGVIVAAGDDGTRDHIGFYDPFTGAFRDGGALLGRHSKMVVLKDGTLFFLGGAAMAEIYNPANRNKTLVGPAQARVETATPLRDGRVLIIGGSAQLFDPVARTFTPTGAGALIPEGHSATLLGDGTVLVAGGSDQELLGSIPAKPLFPEARLYDPVADKFLPVSEMNYLRKNHSAVLLADGKVLLSGGIILVHDWDGSVAIYPSADADLYDPATQGFYPLPYMAMPRIGHTATLLADGRVLLAGTDKTWGNERSTEFYVPPNRPPVANAGPDQQLVAGANCRAKVSFNGYASSDPDGDRLAYTWTGPFGSVRGPTPKVALPIGRHSITLQVTDPSGATGQDTVAVTVLEPPPVITSLTACPATIWPPNKRMVSVAVRPVVVTCAATYVCRIISVTCNEPTTAADIQITAPLAVRLRADRDGHGDGRIYTITVQCTTSGGSATKSVQVTVPHDRSGKGR